MNATIYNLSSMLSDMDDYTGSLQYMESFKDKCMKMYDGRFLACAIGEVAFDLGHLNDTKKVAQRLLEQAFYLTDFYEMGRHHNSIEKYYKEYYDKEKVWYDA